MIAMLAVALAADPPVLPAGTPEPVAVPVEGETWLALHPDLYRWRLARSAYADQLAAELTRSEGLRAAGDLELQACTLRLDAERSVSDAWARRVEEWERYAQAVERRERRQGLRDAGLVLGGMAVVVGGAWVASLAP